MTNPSILILDEATEGLAPLIRQEIWSVIGRLKKETAMSLIIVDKSLKEMRQVADKDYFGTWVQCLGKCHRHADR